MPKWNDKNIVKHFERKIADKLELVGEYVGGAAKLRCPVDTGNLRDSINHKVNKQELSVRIGTPVEYAPWIELGTKNTSAQPFLRPALLESKSEIKQILNS